MLRTEFIFYIGLFLLSACHSQRRIVNHNLNPILETAITFVHHLNNRNFDQLESFYANDFEGLSPIVKFQSKAVLLQSIRKNYSSNSNLIKADILETKTGNTLGYILFRWRILAPTETQEWEIILDKKMLSIWQLDAQGRWQISRMLFYNETEGFGIK